MEKHWIVVVHITDRIKRATKCKRRSRVRCSISAPGPSPRQHDVCSPNGLILLEAVGDEGEIQKMIAKLKTFEGVDVQQMVFDHRLNETVAQD